jgi:DNA-binding PadR family transcriptional regulator
MFTICDQMARHLLTDFELMILLAVLRIGDDAYGVPVAREIETTARRSVARAAVYAALDRLEERGLVSSRQGDPTPERGGRAKRFFAVTGKGIKAVRDTQRALTALWHGVPALKGGEAS